MMDYLWQYDPYGHNVVIHTGPSNKSQYNSYLAPNSKLTGASLQISNAVTDTSIVFDETKTWWDSSDSANGGSRPWVVACDEQGGANTGVDCTVASQDDARKNTLWGNIMAGGAGVEYYYGYQSCTTDLNSQSHIERAQIYQDTGHAIHFWMDYDIQFQNMRNRDDLTTSGHCLYSASDAEYVVYLTSGGSANLNLQESGIFEVTWFDPRNGGDLQDGTVLSVTGPGSRSLGSAPSSTTSDWAILVRPLPDDVPPTPNPAQWQTVPNAVDDHTITMTAVAGTDIDSPPVEYYFTVTSGDCLSVDSDWQSDPTFTLGGLAAGRQYCFTVKMRDQSGNETA